MYEGINCRIIHGYSSILESGIVKNLMKMRTKENKVAEVGPTLLNYCILQHKIIYTCNTIIENPNLGSERSVLNICPTETDFKVFLCICCKIILLQIHAGMSL